MLPAGSLVALDPLAIEGLEGAARTSILDRKGGFRSGMQAVRRRRLVAVPDLLGAGAVECPGIRGIRASRGFPPYAGTRAIHLIY
jgi:hypothetical protein